MPDSTTETHCPDKTTSQTNGERKCTVHTFQ